jgi:hypothetical protein
MWEIFILKVISATENSKKIRFWKEISVEEDVVTLGTSGTGHTGNHESSSAQKTVPPLGRGTF